MAKKFAAPKALSLDDAADEQDLPMTGVKEKKSVLTIIDLQNQLSQYVDQDEPPQPQAPENEPEPEPQATDDPWSKRYGDLRRHAQKKEETYQKQVKDLQKQLNQLSEASKQPMPKTKEEFLRWKEQYPDIATFIEIIADEKAVERAKQVKEQLDTVQMQLRQTTKEKAEVKLQTLVPDLDIEKIKAGLDQVFLAWLSKQPDTIQTRITESDDPEEVAAYLNFYKASITPGAPQTVKKVDKTAALDVTVKNTGSSPDRNSQKYKFTTSQIQKMSPQEYVKNEVAIDEAERQGLIYDDMSKKTRHTDI